MESISKLIANLGTARLIALVGTLVAMITCFVYLMSRSSTLDMAVLFNDLDSADGGKIIERLKGMNIPYEIKGEYNQIFVPMEEVARLRMELAQDGLPAGGTVGYEIFDKSDVLGTASSILDINYARALEGELSKSIRTIQGVHWARVHLVLPKKEIFSQDKQPPAASIIIKMRGSSRLSTDQVQSIRHLTASAVPSLTLDKVSIIDDKGTLLAKGNDSIESPTSDGFNYQQDARQAFENKTSRSIESLLEKALGYGKTRVEVTAEMDFDKTTFTTVEYNPDGQVARSVSSSEEGRNANEAGSSDAVSIQNALPDAAAQGAGGSQSKEKFTHNEENTTYEISNTTKTQVKETGSLKRLSVAVLVDGNYETGKDGKSTYTPRSNEELEQLTTLVKTAIGFKEDRGDAVKVINLKFTEVLNEEPIIEKTPWYQKIDLMKAIIWIALGIFVLILGFGVIRPALLALAVPSKVSKAGALFNNSYINQGGALTPTVIPTVNEKGEIVYTQAPIMAESPEEMEQLKARRDVSSMINLEDIEGRVGGSASKKISEIIDKHPEGAASILRGWINSPG